MMAIHDIPKSAALLGAAGLIPFVWGALTYLSPELQGWGARTFGPRFVGPYISLFYGAIILAFMSGVLWGFAAKATGAVAASGYALSVLPALWAFFQTGAGPVSSAIALMAGFIGVLGIDFMFWRQGLAPSWWMALRIPLTVIVVLSLAVVAFA